MSNNIIEKYLEKAGSNINAGLLSYVASLAQVKSVSPVIAKSIVAELESQRSSLKLIASENYCSLPTQATMGNLLTDKYAEGFPLHRFYAGCDNVDAIELEACEQAKKLFGAECAYVQPHSGADANMIAFMAILHKKVGGEVLERLKKEKINDLTDAEWAEYRREMGNQKLLGLDYYSGGHLTHGYRFNISAQLFDAHGYKVREDNWLLDYDQIEAQAKEVKPVLLLAGYSAYPRAINFRRMREIADSVGAVLMVDMAHFAGLVAGGVFQGDNNPVKFAHILTSTTHKTLRGPRGGIVLCTEEYKEFVERGCPYVIGGPLPQVMASKAVAFTEANTQSFKDYAKKIVENAQALAEACQAEGIEVATGGTDNHLMLLDMRPFGITGRQAEAAVRECSITLNRNSLPYDTNGAWFTSGLRIGTPAITTLGMGTAEMLEIAKIIKLVVSNTKPSIMEKGANAGKPSKTGYVIDQAAKTEAQARVKAMLSRFPVYPELDLDFLKEHFC